ncbi:MAG: DUF4279 domain-containing protein [Acidobacteriaceae bacterium]
MAFPLGNFTLIGAFDPDDISRQLGLTPSLCNRIGSINPASGEPRTCATWTLFVDEEDGGDVSDQVIKLLVKLEGNAQTVTGLSERFTAYIQVYASLHECHSGFFLNAGLLKDLADLNVDLECSYIREDQLGDSGETNAD